MISMLIFFSCGGSQNYPPVSDQPTKTYTYGKVVWRDLATPDPQAAISFYKNVFGWTFTKTEPGDRPYWLIKNNGKTIGGLFELNDEHKKEGAEWICSISVPSVKDALRTAGSNGGRMIIGETDLPGRGKLALMNDDQKAPAILLHSSSGDPLPVNNIKNQWLWSELWSNDVQQSENYYKALINGTIDKTKDDSRDYIVIESNGQKCMGIIKNPVENVRSHWMQYILVDDVNAVFEKAKTAGAKVLIAPSEDIRKGTVAVLIDPTGAPFAIQKWPIN